MADEKTEKPKESVGQSERRKYSDKLVEVIRENERRKEQRIFQEELAKRIQLARDGRYSYERKDLKTATQNYKRFLSLTAKSLGVELKDLHPRLFEEKVKVAESLLVSAIVFDLAKIFDRVKGGEKERQQYLRLMVLFTSGQPFQFFVSENLNKFIKYTPNILHINEFKAAQRALRKGGLCFIATVCYESTEAPELDRLRQFRNEVLWPNPLGALCVDFYYLVSPSIAKQLSKAPRARAQCKKLLLTIDRHLQKR